MGKFRLAVLGLNQGAKAARDAVAGDDFDLVAIGGFGEQAEAMQKELSESKGTDIPLFADFKDLYKEIPIDAVVIALPNGLHWVASRIFRKFRLTPIYPSAWIRVAVG